MRLGIINLSWSKQLKLVSLAFFMLFLLWEWANITFYDSGALQPHPLDLTNSDQHTTSKEDFPQSVVEVEKKVTGAGARPPLSSMTAYAVDVADENEVPPHEKKECNYRNGKWVSDNRRPLYLGFGCKQWLLERWSCRLTHRADFAYEKFRWQPEACEMPEFEASKFLWRMQDKTIAYVGDSLGRQMFQSMMCMVTGGKPRPDVEDVRGEYGFVLAPGSKRLDGLAYRFPSTNTTILYRLSSTLCDLEPLNPSDGATRYAMHLDRPAAFLKNNLHKFHVLILNTGDHWNEWNLKSNNWEMYLGGVPNNNPDIAIIRNAKNFTIHSVVKWLDAQLPHHRQLKVFYRSISPHHFFNGDWNTGGRCDNTNPLAKGSGIHSNRSEDANAEGAVRGTRIRLLDVTALSRLREEGHISRYSIKATRGVQDCLHWCLPGVPDTWNEILAAQL